MYVTEDTIRTDRNRERLYATPSAASQFYCLCEHRRPSTPQGAYKPHKNCHRRSREAQRRKNSRRLARPNDRGFSGGKFTLAVAPAQTPSCRRQLPRRTRRQHTHGTNARQSPPDGPPRPRPFPPEGNCKKVAPPRTPHPPNYPVSAATPSAPPPAFTLPPSSRPITNRMRLADASQRRPSHLFGLDQVIEIAP